MRQPAKREWRHRRAWVIFVHARCEVDRALSDEEVLCFKSYPNRNGITLCRLSLVIGGFKETVLFFHFQLHSLGSFEPCASARWTTSISLANVSLRSREFFGSVSSVGAECWDLLPLRGPSCHQIIFPLGLFGAQDIQRDLIRRVSPSSSGARRVRSGSKVRMTLSECCALDLYDWKPMSESVPRNQAERGIIEETSTSVLFGATFTIAAFQGRLCGRQ